MPDIIQSSRLTHEGALRVLQAAISKAEAIGVPQCIAVVDHGGHLLAFARMDGAKILSIDSATAKAVTAASSNVSTGGVPTEMEMRLALATGGKLTNLLGGLPIVVRADAVGAIGVGSGTGEQDVEVAQAGVAALRDATAS